MFLKFLGEMSNFAMGTILGKTLAQAQVVTNHSTCAEVYDDEKFMRIPRFSGLRVPYWKPYTEVNQLLGYNFRKQRWKRQQPLAILTFFGYPKFLFFLLFPMGNFACCTCTSIVSKVSLLFIVVKRVHYVCSERAATSWLFWQYIMDCGRYMYTRILHELKVGLVLHCGRICFSLGSIYY